MKYVEYKVMVPTPSLVLKKDLAMLTLHFMSILLSF